MTTLRINTFYAKDGMVSHLTEFLKSIIPLIKSSQGCISCRLIQKHDDEHEILIIEEWDSQASHQASAKAIPAEQISAVMPMLAKPPSGAYYRV